MILRVFVLFMALTIAFRADAREIPGFSGAVNKAVAQVIEKAAARRGVAPNDPKMAATYQAVGAVATDLAMGAAIYAVTAASAPLWVSVVGAMVVIGGLLYGGYKLLYDGDSSGSGFVLQKGGSAGQTPAGTVLSAPSVTGEFTGMTDNRGYNQPVFAFGGTKAVVHGAIVNSDAPEYVFGSGSDFSNVYVGSHPYTYRGYNIYCATLNECKTMIAWLNTTVWGQGTNFMTPVITGSQIELWVNGSFLVMLDITPNPYRSSPGETIKGPITEVVEKIDEAELQKEADPSTVAAIANKLWEQAASKPGYAGVPFSPSDPVMVDDVVAARAAAPTWIRNVDLIAPVSTGAGQPVPIHPTTITTSPSPEPQPQPQPQPGTITDVRVVNTPTVRLDGAVDVNWGDAPHVSEPSLEGTPTAQQILSPILNLMPTLKTMVVPSNAGECPAPRFTLFRRAMAIDAHCTVLEPVRPTLHAVMAFIWLMAGTLIILRA